MIKDRLQIARGSAARITSFLNSFRDYEIIFNTDTNRLGIVLPNKTIVYIGALDINEHNTNENAHSDIRQLISDLQSTVDDIENIIGSIDGEEDADNVINKLHEIVNLLNGYAEGATLVNLLSTKADTSHNHTLSEITDYVAPTIPTISTSITTDATDDTKTASPKAVKTYVDNAINSAILGLLGGES